MIRDDIEATLRSKLQSGSSVAAVIQFDLGADGVIVLNGMSSPASVAQTGPQPDTTITVTATDLQAMLAGELKPMEAYSTGRLDVAGDIGPAMQLSSLLG